MKKTIFLSISILLIFYFIITNIHITRNPLYKAKNTYDFIPISAILFIAYLITYYLSKQKKITVTTHRKIWNFFLLISFLIVATLGVLLVIRINYGIVVSLPFNMLFYHVEAGIAMTVISVFHILWHWSYFMNLFKFKKKSKK